MNRDSALFDEVYAATCRPLLAYVRALVRDPDEQADVIQDTYVALFKRLQTFEPDQLLGYALTTARNAALARRRADQKHRLDPLPEIITTDPENSGNGEEIDRAIAQLSDEQREVFVLRHHADMSYAEIGRICGIPEGTVASRMHLAIRALRRRLAATVDMARADASREGPNAMQRAQPTEIEDGT